jgi:hypothetical protein
MRRVGLALLLTGCAVGTHPASPVTDAGAPEVELVTPFGIPGESMELEASLRGLSVGRVITAVGQIGVVDGKRSIIVKSRGQSTGMIALLAELTWEMTSTIDLDHGYAIASHEEMWSVLAGTKHHESNTQGDESQHDLHSAIAAVRAWRSLPGQRAKLGVSFGGSARPTELVDTSHGYLVSAHQPAVRYDGIFDDEIHFVAWVSDDIARVPLRFECDLEHGIGHLVIDLVHYTAPTDAP